MLLCSSLSKMEYNLNREAETVGLGISAQAYMH